MKQPSTWLDDGPEDVALARALRDARADVLPAEGVERVRAQLVAVGAFAAAGSGALAGATRGAPKTLPPAASKFVATSLVLKIGAAVIAFAAIAAAIALLRPPRERDASPSAAPLPPPELAISESAATPEPPPSGSTAEITKPSAPLTDPVANPRLTAAPSSAPRKPPTTEAVSADAAAPSAREGTLLLEARRALDADPARALDLVRAHEAEFPQSQLAPERERIATEAKKRLQK